ncbi:epidermal growth factor receptor substrate 15-like 1 isoform X1 [Nerophis ophidion]|uniref:epidermal growth factor receptor substrate 15-like 1 isoform X1 n=1 Tax=Nerophis ophidion TaxID=159077 RepID=UPI002ADFC278|nr:epidermal growth factor receptor substrate 15-like 1 isoform X1 [Nerophis ophidion]
MAALLTLSQLSGGNPAYESYYRQLDPVSSGKVSAGDAAQFLKKSGLSDNTLGKIWDLADAERKGYLDKRGFFIALRLVASAQAGHEVSLSNLSQTVLPPKFRDNSSPLLSASATDSSWAIRPDEKGKFEGIFESLSPVNGLLAGDKVKPILINSKLPLDALGKIWDLGDTGKDGYLDKEEFIVVMHLVYRAMENEPVPTTLPASLIPPSKRKKVPGALPGAVAVLPSRPGFLSTSLPLKDTLRSASPLTTSTRNLSPKYSFRASKQPEDKWVVPVADRERYYDIFKQTTKENDSLISGTEVIEIFMHSSLSQTMLAQIWGLADTKQTGKLTREQFCLAMHLIQQKITKDIDPPSTLTPDMIPPSERTAALATIPPSFSGFLFDGRAGNAALSLCKDIAVAPAELTGIKELDDLSQEISQLQRDKYILEQEIREMQETIRKQNISVQDMQQDFDRESSSLQDMEFQKQDAQKRLDEMDQQRSKLEGMLNDVKQKCQEETQMISTLQSQIRSEETNLQSQEQQVGRTKADLSRLQEEEAQLEQNLLSGRVQLDSITKSLKNTQEEMNQARSKLSLLQENQKEVSKTIEQYNAALSDLGGGNNMADMTDLLAENENSVFRSVDESFKSRLAMFNQSASKAADPFQTEDPFKSNLFKESDPFKGTSSEDVFSRTGSLFAHSEAFAGKPRPPIKPGSYSDSDRFSSLRSIPKNSESFRTADHFGSTALRNKAGFTDFGQMSKKSDNPVLPSKKSIPSRPAPPYENEGEQLGSESQQLEWAKRESERVERDRLQRLKVQEQQDLELAIALSRADVTSS